MTAAATAGHYDAAAATAAPFATLGDRLLAQFLDLTTVLAAARLIFAAIMRGLGTAYVSRPMEFVFIAILLLVLAGYFIVADARHGVTIGKWVAGIRVEPAGEAPLSMRRSITRNLWRILDCAPAYLPGAVSIIVTVTGSFNGRSGRSIESTTFATSPASSFSIISMTSFGN